MIVDTNQINQAAAVVADVKSQVQTNWPAIAFAVALLARELRNFNVWCRSAAEFAVSHGGIIRLFCKLFWNPPTAGPSSIINRQS